MNIDEYINAHISAEPQHLRELTRQTYLRTTYPRMCSGHMQGRLLKMLTQMINPRRILELGTFTGYSALCMAEGMAPEAILHTIEVDDEMAEWTRQTLESSPWGQRIRLHVGDALEIIPTLDEDWDMVFIDANKRHYIDYYEMLMARMRHGTYILADNTLWDGKVTDSDEHHDTQTQAILAFNDHIAADTRVEQVILPVRDGLTIARVNQAPNPPEGGSTNTPNKGMEDTL